MRVSDRGRGGTDQVGCVYGVVGVFGLFVNALGFELWAIALWEAGFEPKMLCVLRSCSEAAKAGSV